MPHPPRLLVISHDYSLTGAPIALLNLVTGLPTHFDILVASPFDGPLRQHFLARQIHAIVAPNLHQDINIAGALLLSYDAVFANTIVSFLPIHAAHQLHKPSLWYLHEGQAAGYFCKTFPGIVPAFGLATRIVVPCKFSQSFYHAVRPFTDLVPYGIEFRESPPRAPRSRPMKILQLGSIEPRKGQDIACAAIQLLQNHPLELHIVGQPLANDYYMQLRSSYANLSQIHFYPGIDLSQTPALIAQCDALVVPSRDEVTPLVILEAMAAAKPVIASAVGGIPEMIVDGQTGFLFPPENADQLAAVLARIANDDSAGRSIATAAQQFVRSQRTLTQYCDGFAKILRDILPPSGK
jgi:glycosyltransferase involved in cell wall biosynthesis